MANILTLKHIAGIKNFPKDPILNDGRQLRYIFSSSDEWSRITDVHAPLDDSGNTALHYLMDQMHVSTADAFIQKKANFLILNDQMKSPLEVGRARLNAELSKVYYNDIFTNAMGTLVSRLSIGEKSVFDEAIQECGLPNVLIPIISEYYFSS